MPVTHRLDCHRFCIRSVQLNCVSSVAHARLCGFRRQRLPIRPRALIGQRLQVELRQLPVAVGELIRLVRRQRFLDLELLEILQDRFDPLAVGGVEGVLHA